MGEAARGRCLGPTVSLADDILAAIPHCGCPLKEIWQQFRTRPVQAIEAALNQLKATASVRVLNGAISRTHLPAMPQERPRPTAASIGLSEADRRLQVAMLINRERERLTAECRAIRLDRGLATLEQSVSIRQAEEASEQRVRALQRRLASPQTAEAS